MGKWEAIDPYGEVLAIAVADSKESAVEMLTGFLSRPGFEYLMYRWLVGGRLVRPATDRSREVSYEDSVDGE